MLWSNVFVWPYKDEFNERIKSNRCIFVLDMKKELKNNVILKGTEDKLIILSGWSGIQLKLEHLELSTER